MDTGHEDGRQQGKRCIFFPQFDNQNGKKNVSQINTGLLLSAVILNYSSLRL